MDHAFIFLGISFLSFFTFRNSTVGMIERTGTNTRYYPKHYIVPQRWVKKLFGIKDRVIPKYLYRELFLSIFFAILGPINIAIYVCAGSNKDIGGWLVMLHVCLMLSNTIYFLVMSYFFSKR